MPTLGLSVDPEMRTQKCHEQHFFPARSFFFPSIFFRFFSLTSIRFFAVCNFVVVFYLAVNLVQNCHKEERFLVSDFSVFVFCVGHGIFKIMADFGLGLSRDPI